MSRTQDTVGQVGFCAMPELIADHEAGHALMALLLGGKVKQVTIEADNDDGLTYIAGGLVPRLRTCCFTRL